MRKDKVYAHLISLCNTKKNTKNQNYEVGFSAEKIALDLGLTRTNVSSDLNKLYREGKVIKFEGRPTLYVDEKWAKKNSISKVRENIVKRDNLNLKGFKSLIGSQGSLHQMIKQAQAAVLYPPNGLPMLIVGKTGTGKTTFVENIYKFYMNSKKLKGEYPYVAFNCADYANNPQLLISILFGSVKGAYTGSDIDKEGLVEKANGGILFLDEVHRLPPEGQEMLFTLMDSGKFRRLGDTKLYSANVLIIAATTEDPKSSLLSTFCRRFSIVLEMPDLAKRGFEEKFDIIYNFFCNESERVGKVIRVSRDVMSILMAYSPRGNIGQLRATIELISSRAYLDHLIYNNDIKILTSHLPNDIIQNLNEDMEVKRKIENIIGFNDYIFNTSNNNRLVIKDTDSYDFSYKIYEYLDYKKDLYVKEGMNKADIAERLYKDLEEIFYRYKNGINSINLKETELGNFLNLDLYYAIKLIAEEVFVKYKYHIKENTLIALTLHLNSVFEIKKRIENINLKDIEQKYPREYLISEYIIKKIEILFNKEISAIELGFITLILYHSNGEEGNNKVGIMVISHGEGIATGMANLVNEILSTNHVRAIDMKLENRVADVLDEAVELAKELDEGKGILLFVDMGSLKTFGEEIEKRTNIKIISLDNVSTPSLIQATHKAMLPYCNLKDVALSVIELNQNLIKTSSQEINYINDKDGVIFTVCSTGEGAATYVKELIEKTLLNNNIGNISVIEMKINNKEKAREEMKRISNGREILAIAGSIDPELEGVPFIRLMDFVIGNAQERLVRYVTKNNLIDVEIYESNRDIIDIMLINTLDENLRFLSGKKVINYIKMYIETIEKERNIKLTNHKYILFSIHLSYCIERLKFNERNISIDGYKSRVVPRINEDFSISLNEEEDIILEEILYED